MLLHSTVCTDNQIRIVDAMGRNATEGLLEVCTGGGWGTVCGTSFGSSNAQVVCQQLGLETTGKLYNCKKCSWYKRFIYNVIIIEKHYYFLAAAVLSRVSSPPDIGSLPIVMDLVMCTGTENQLVDCARAPIVEGCSHSMDTGVNCTTPISGEYDCVLVLFLSL